MPMKRYLVILLSSGLYLSILNASVSQGKEVYKKRCQQCHNYAKAMAGSKSSAEWKKVFDKKDSANVLAQTHLKAEKAKASWDYFQNPPYAKEVKHVKDFMLKYSSDRGRHNSCN